MLSTFLTLLGFSLGGYLLARYRLWRDSRATIPMELQGGVWVPDGKLKRWERRARIGILLWGAFCLFAAFMWGALLGMESLPQ